ncbi:methyltransferase domain-containing protein [Paenibacillus pasadenensis]|uniref:class I SAM-dependent methyltransferase n=1 Tax=Paenibacillus pasadenensis TaxID=217090 RepID=UPI00203F1B9B|nr:methyltransferase domain-containing protein [Paenibacillus pasadenensis]MCM3747651.1 methyltransferase domain-containing protein [Paenibacillus pasadenensis]
MKYDFDLDLSTANSLSILASRIKAGSTVLEFGPATGRFTKHLKQNLGCKVYIVEIDPDSAAHASLYAEETLVGNIEENEWLTRFSNISFDHIIFADVLEHLIDPTQVLVNCKNILKMDGTVLISVPHIGHNSILINLFNNKFEYQKIGLLDETHLKFFTKGNLEKMIEESGYTSIFKDAVYKNLEETEFNVFFDQLPKSLQYEFKNREYGNVYQFVYEIQSGESSLLGEEDYIKRQSDIYFSQLYYDLGEGFSEELSTKKPISIKEKTIRMQANDDFKSPLKRIRFDFINTNAILYIRKVYAVGPNLTIFPLVWSESNHHFEKNDFFIFRTEDPQLIFEEIPENQLSEIVMEVEFIQVDLYIQDLIYQTIIDQTSLIQRQIKELDVVNTQLNLSLTEIEGLKGRLNELQNLNNHLKASHDEEKSKNARNTNQINEMARKMTILDSENEALRRYLDQLLFMSPYKHPIQFLKLRKEYRSDWRELSND